VPIGSGLSSSAAVQVAFAFAWNALDRLGLDPMSLARLAQRSENAYLAINSGLMDQFASAHGVEGHCLYFDTRSLEWEPVSLPPGTALVIADSGVRRTLAGSAYNERRLSCEEAVERLREYLPGIQTLRDVLPTEFAAYSEFLPEIPRKRAEHVVKEIARVESAVTALKTGRVRSFGALMFAGHASLRDLYEVSTPELDALVEIARELPGIIGARLTGAGFGGCTVNLVEESAAPAFAASLADAYRERTGREAKVMRCKASRGAWVEDYR
jgi:galactokinase